MSLAEAADTIGIVRDVAVIVILAAALLILLLLFRRVSKILDAAGRTLSSAEQIAETLSTKIVGPAAAGSGAAFGAGKLAAFVIGFRNRRKKGGQDDGK